MADYRVEHDRAGCISCGACAAVCPKFWEMEPDGKSKLKGSKGNKLEIAKKDLKCNMEAAEGCPATVIHITDLKTKKKLI